MKPPIVIGPYRSCVRAGELLFTSGQIPIDPGTGSIVSGGIVGQTHQTIRNLAAVLAHEDATLGDVVQATVFLSRMSDFESMNRVYCRHFAAPRPARTCVAAAGLPRGVLVEIAAVARAAPTKKRKVRRRG